MNAGQSARIKRIKAGRFEEPQDCGFVQIIKSFFNFKSTSFKRPAITEK
jgi:hypothetical protein